MKHWRGWFQKDISFLFTFATPEIPRRAGESRLARAGGGAISLSILLRSMAIVRSLDRPCLLAFLLSFVALKRGKIQLFPLRWSPTKMCRGQQIPFPSPSESCRLPCHHCHASQSSRRRFLFVNCNKKELSFKTFGAYDSNEHLQILH